MPAAEPHPVPTRPSASSPSRRARSTPTSATTRSCRDDGQDPTSRSCPGCCRPTSRCRTTASPSPTGAPTSSASSTPSSRSCSPTAPGRCTTSSEDELPDLPDAARPAVPGLTVTATDRDLDRAGDAVARVGANLRRPRAGPHGAAARPRRPRAARAPSAWRAAPARRADLFGSYPPSARSSNGPSRPGGAVSWRLAARGRRCAGPSVVVSGRRAIADRRAAGGSPRQRRRTPDDAAGRWSAAFDEVRATVAAAAARLGRRAGHPVPASLDALAGRRRRAARRLTEAAASGRARRARDRRGRSRVEAGALGRSTGLLDGVDRAATAPRSPRSAAGPARGLPTPRPTAPAASRTPTSPACTGGPTRAAHGADSDLAAPPSCVARLPGRPRQAGRRR